CGPTWAETPSRSRTCRRSEPDARSRAAPVHALQYRAHQHPHREQQRAGDPLRPARARAQLHVVAREVLELFLLLDVVFLELPVLGLELLHALGQRSELAAELGGLRLGLGKAHRSRRLTGEEAVLDPAVSELLGGASHLDPSFAAREHGHRVAGLDIALDPIVIAGTR